MVFGRLCDAFHLFDLGQDFVQQPGGIEQEKSFAGMAFGEHAGEFVTHALARDLMDLCSKFADSGEGSGLDGVAEAGREAHGAQHAEFVFGEATNGIADGANDAGFEVSLAADEVKQA